MRLAFCMGVILLACSCSSGTDSKGNDPVMLQRVGVGGDATPRSAWMKPQVYRGEELTNQQRVQMDLANDVLTVYLDYQPDFANQAGPSRLPACLNPIDGETELGLFTCSDQNQIILYAKYVRQICRVTGQVVEPSVNFGCDAGAGSHYTFEPKLEYTVTER